MKNYVEFSNDGQSYRAYTTLENLFKIEDDLNVSLNDICNKGISNMPKMKVFYNILMVALETSVNDKETREDFCRKYFSANPFLASLAVYQFVGQAMTVPSDDGIPKNKDDDSKKKET